MTRTSPCQFLADAWNRLTREPAVRSKWSARLTLPLSIIAPIGMLLVCGWMLLDLRRDAWDRGEQISSNLLQVLARDIERNIELIDASLVAINDNMLKPGVMESTADLRQIILFDRATMLQEVGSLFVLDAQGNLIHDNRPQLRRSANMADREYFQIHAKEARVGLYVSAPFYSRLCGESIIVVSRRITKADGSFGGVVAGTIRLSYFSRLFRNLNLEANDLVGLYHLDGFRVVSEPFNEKEVGTSILGTQAYQRFQRLRRGRFIETGEHDHVSRHVTFARLGNLPLVLDVGVAVDTIEHEWRYKAAVIGLITLSLCGLIIGLSLTLTRELHRREEAEARIRQMNAELEKLATTDALTNLANRRRFDTELRRAYDESARTGNHLAVLVLDADQFKSYNDRYGHLAGDEVLVMIAGCIDSHSSRPRDLAARIGGEEFAVILPDTDLAGARIVAERIRMSVLAQMRGHLDNPTGYVTVSCGAAAIPTDGIHDPQHLLQTADHWLYAAKTQGRNQVRSAADNEQRAAA